MRKVLYFAALAVIVMSMTSCMHRLKAGPGEETVPVSKPWFFGNGGTIMQPVSTGAEWFVMSTSGVTMPIVPVKHQVDLDDLFSNDNTPLDFHTVIITQIKKGKTPVLLENYGIDWFDTNIKEVYTNRVREYVSQYGPFDLISNREILNDIDENVMKDMQAYTKKLNQAAEFPVEIKQIIVGKASPNKKQLDEMNNTAAQIQAKQTQERAYDTYLAKEKAERQRAKADRAYMEELRMNTDEFIQMKWIETVAASKANIDVMVGPATSMWNIKR
jgi:hypothetical protein